MQPMTSKAMPPLQITYTMAGWHGLCFKLFFQAAWNQVHGTMKMGVNENCVAGSSRPTVDSSILRLRSIESRLMCGGCLRWHPMKYQLVSWSGCSCSLALLHCMTSVPCMKGSDLKWHQDTLGRGRASHVDHSCEHSVRAVTCCYAGGKHLSQSWTCWVSDGTADSIWQDRLSECINETQRNLMEPTSELFAATELIKAHTHCAHTYCAWSVTCATQRCATCKCSKCTDCVMQWDDVEKNWALLDYFSIAARCVMHLYAFQQCFINRI